MDWLFPSVLASLTGSVILFAVYAYLYRIERRSYLKPLALGWALYAARFVCMLLYIRLDLPCCMAANQLFSLWSGLVILIGLYQLTRRRFNRIWLLAGLAGSSWIVLSISAKMDFLWTTVPTFAFLGYVFVYAGWLMLRYKGKETTEQQIVGWAFILWGLHKADYPFLRPVAWFAPYGYLLGAIFELIAALGLLLIYFRENKSLLLENEAKFKTLFSEAMDPIIAADAETGLIVECNQAAEKSFGLPREKLVGRHQKKLHPEGEAASGFSPSFEKHLRNPGQMLETPLVGPKGEEWLAEVRTALVEIKGRRTLLGIMRDVTENKRAATALAEREDVLRAIFEHSPLGLIYFDSSGTIINCNDKFVEQMGSSRDKLIGFNTARDSNDAKMRHSLKIALGGQNSSYEGLYTSATGGKTTYLRVLFQPIRPGETPTEVIATLEDLTDWLEAEKDLTRVLEMSTDLICVADLETYCLIRINSAFTNTLGHSEKNLLNRPITNFIHPDDLGETIRTIETQLKEGNKVFGFENRYRCADGSYRWLQWTSHPLPEKKLAYAVARDVTEEKKNQERLKRSEARYRLLFQEMMSGFALHEIILDRNGAPSDYRFLEVNSEFERMTGLKREEILGKTVLEVLPRTEKYWIDNYGKVALTGKPIDFENYSRELDKYFEVKAYSPQPMQFATIFTDITIRKQSEKMLLKAKEAAEAANLSKSEFLAVMSHELRTPLNGVFGMLQILKDSELSEDQRECVNIASQCGQGLLSIIQDLLEFAKAESGKLRVMEEEFNLDEILCDVRNTFRASILEKKLSFSSEIAPDVPKQLFGGKRRLRQILINLVGNAVKFTPSGSVSLKALLSPLSNDGETLILDFQVQDTGIGIPEDKLENIFDPFTQVEMSMNRGFGGVGLGLGIVKKLTELLGGSVRLESTPGQGTTAFLSLPFKPGTQEESAPAMEKEKTASPRDKRRVLVAEDDKVNQLATRMALEKDGYEVYCAGDGLEALELLKSKDFDMILMDIQMPRLDGVETARRIRNDPEFKDKSKVPIIALTAYAMTGDREKFLEAGMNGYLAKPFNLKEMLDIVEKKVTE